MREIKFRAWDKNVNKMVVTDNSLYFMWIKEGVAIELMQFTGLKDKNGKDIYEGDIVKYKDNFGYLKVVEIVWRYHEMANSGWFDTVIMAGPLELPKCCEVIGNIYENPELLKLGDKNDII